MQRFSMLLGMTLGLALSGTLLFSGSAVAKSAFGGWDSGSERGSGKNREGRGDRSERRIRKDFDRMDTNGDQAISPAEWLRRGNFARLDSNDDGELDFSEVRVLYRESMPKHRPGGSADPAPLPERDIDAAILRDQVADAELDDANRCGIARGRDCDPYDAVERGMIATGLGPRFPSDLDCHAIDDYWALDYSYKRKRQAWHGGIDLPADWGTPMLAVADGTVAAVFAGDRSARGKEIILRHAPEQTGLPFWTWSGYGHLDALTSFETGQRIRKGQNLGPTGNSGVSGTSRKENTRRRAAIHFSMMYSDSPQYAIVRDTVVPKGGYWMDPVGFYRSTGPWNSAALKNLPESDKFVDIPVILEDGDLLPANTKRIWPYSCSRD